MSNFGNSLKAPTQANHNLAKVDSHLGHFKKICQEPGQKSFTVYQQGYYLLDA
jgi:hypothetical protein